MSREANSYIPIIGAKKPPDRSGSSIPAIIAIILIVGLGIVMPRGASAQTFNDVPTSNFAFDFIETLAASGITSGCGGNNYCPDDSVTRAQMAVFLERGMNGSGFNPPTATGNVFLDVGANDFAASFIEQLFLDGITSGCGSGNYCPNNPVTRAQMAVFLLRAKFGSDYVPPVAVGMFSDVDQGYWAAGWIEQLAAEAITSGCGGGNYCPDDPVTRAQMAVFLVRAFDLDTMPSGAIISGLAQKGPYVADSEIIAYRLNDDGSRSSESSSTVTTSNLGDYETEITWQGLTEVVANGTYFDEVSAAIGPVSAQLSVITAIQNNSLVNINLFTHLQSVRFRSLLAGDSGLSTEDALELAEQELRAEIGLGQLTEVATLDLTDGFGENRSDNASLLLFSAAVAQYVSGGGAIDDLVADFADDGEFDGSAGFDFGVIRALATTIGLDSIRPALLNLGAADPPAEEDLAGVIQTVMSGIYDTGSSQTWSFKTADGSPIWLASDESEVEVAKNDSGVDYIARITTRSSDGVLFETNYDALNQIVDWFVASTNLSVSGEFDGSTPGRTVVHDGLENVTYHISSSNDSGSAETSSAKLSPLAAALPTMSQNITSTVNIERGGSICDSSDLTVWVQVSGIQIKNQGLGGTYYARNIGPGQYEADLLLLDPAPFVEAETARCDTVFKSISDACFLIDAGTVGSPAQLADVGLALTCKEAAENAKANGLSDVLADSLGALCARTLSGGTGISSRIPLCLAANTASILQVCKVFYGTLLNALVNGKFSAHSKAFFKDKPHDLFPKMTNRQDFETLFNTGVGPTFTIDAGSDPRIKTVEITPLKPTVDGPYEVSVSFNCSGLNDYAEFSLLRFDKDGGFVAGVDHLRISADDFEPTVLSIGAGVDSGAVLDKIEIVVFKFSNPSVTHTWRGTVKLMLPDPFVGSWTVTEVATSSDPICNETSEIAVTVSMQDGSYSVSFPGVSLPGTRVGDKLQISISGSFPEDGGTTTQTGSGAFTSQGTFSGSSTWTFVGEGDFTCSGSSTFFGDKS